MYIFMHQLFKNSHHECFVIFLEENIEREDNFHGSLLVSIFARKNLVAFNVEELSLTKCAIEKRFEKTASLI